MTVDELPALEQRVGEKWLAAASARMPQWEMPDDPFDMSAWLNNVEPLSSDVPQFPREQWAIYPTRRTVTLLTCDRLLDKADELTDEQWMNVCLLMQFGGKTRLT